MVFIYLLFNAGRGAKQRGRGMRGMLQDYRERGGFADRTVIVAAPAIVGVSFTLRRLFSASRDVSTFSLVLWFRSGTLVFDTYPRSFSSTINFNIVL